MNETTKHITEPRLDGRADRFRVALWMRSKASVVRSLAGVAAGWRQSRRGSFLVLVVGVLAILSVLAILYASIGNADRQRSSAVVKNERLNEVPTSFADYILSIIADDRVASHYDDSQERQPDATGALTNLPVLMREVTDYPYTPYEMTSQLPTGNLPAGDIAFNPAGAYQPTGADGIPRNIPRRWAASDPWLASLRPAFLDFRSSGPISGEPYHVNDRDWPHISNVMPNGMFVNLWNLRNNFDARPGINAGQMSSNLSLLESSGNINVPPSPTNALEWGAAADPRRPAHWDSRQVGAARPASEVRLEPNNPNYALYQWADADGDGILDSRIGELRFEGVRPDGTTGILDLLPADPRFRYFFAARIVDASGLVNVNTATDFVARPSPLAPVGSSPAEVDLLGTLTMRNQIDYYSRLAGPARSGTYGGIAGGDTGIPGNTFNNRDREDYSEYLRVPIEDRPFLIGYFGYEAVRLSIASGITPKRYFPVNNIALVGDIDPAADALRGVFAQHHGLNDPSWYVPDPTATAPHPPSSRWDFSVNHDLMTGTLTTPAQADRIARARQRYYETRLESYQGLVLSTSNDSSGNLAAFSNSPGWFDATDAAELFARAGVNDLRVTSNLEAALDGRHGGFPNLGPMRSGRSDKKELLRDRRHNPIGSQRDGAIDRDASNLLAVDVRSLITPFSGGSLLRPVRGVSRDSLSAGEAAINVEAAALRINHARNPTDDGRDVNGDGAVDANYSGLDTIFRGYADALAGFSNIRAAWQAGGAGANQYDTLFYGYKGPAFALITAGSMAVNFKDSYDNDGVQSQYTLLLDTSYRATLRMELNRPLDQQQFPAWQDGQSLDLDGGIDVPNTLSRLATNQNETPTRAITLFGVEAQPFITQVVTFTTYSDAPPSFGGDNEGPDEVTINGDVKESNHDCLYRCTAIKLTNPFDVTVTLSNWTLPAGTNGDSANAAYFDVGEADYPAIDREPNFYYLEIDGKYYKLASLVETEWESNPGGIPVGNIPRAYDDTRVGEYFREFTAPDYRPPTSGPVGMTLRPLSIGPGQSIIVYTLSQLPQTIFRGRFARLDGTPIPPNPPNFGKVAKNIRLAIQNNMGGGPGMARMYMIPEMKIGPGVALNDPNYGKVDLPRGNDFRRIITNPRPTVNLWRALRTPSLRDANNNPIPGANDEITGTNPSVPTATLPSVYWDGTTRPLSSDALNLLPHNILTNDLLVDRFQIPATANMDRKLPTGVTATRISAPGAGDDGWTCTVWTSVRRPDAPQRPTPHGAIPAYCIEPKHSSTPWNIVQNDGFVAQRSYFQGNSGGLTAASWRNKLATASTGTYMVQTLGRGPDYNTSNPLRDPPLGMGGTPEPFERHYTQPLIDNQEFSYTDTNAVPDRKVSRLRVADMLTPLAFGPMYDPNQAKPAAWDAATLFPPTWPASAVTRYAQWTTLGEQLAMSMGYEEIDLSGADSGVYALYQPRVDPDHNVITLFDRGQLHLDRYAPYRKNNNDPNARFDPANDQPRGLRAPLALGIIDQFVTGTIASKSGITSITPGLININTAPVMNLRAVPMLSPAFGPDPRTGQPLWWWQPVANAVPQNVIHPVTAESDIATTVAAYRDKIGLFTRPVPLGGNFADVYIQFRDNNGADPARQIPPDSDVGTPGRLNGRAWWSSVEAINERPGFASRGELMCVRQHESPDRNDPSWSDPYNIDFAGYDRMDPSDPNSMPLNNTLAGVSVAPIGGQPPSNSLELGNEWSEKLTVAAGALGSTSVRSDVFICWFVVYGFQRSDCENLSDDQPLVPSIARRFMMVVDRSNVTSRGERPKVLLFKEVPM